MCICSLFQLDVSSQSGAIPVFDEETDPFNETGDIAWGSQESDSRFPGGRFFPWKILDSEAVGEDFSICSRSEAMMGFPMAMYSKSLVGEPKSGYHRHWGRAREEKFGGSM